MIIFQKMAFDHFFYCPLLHIKKKRKLFLGFKLMFQSSFTKFYVAVYSILKISSWFFGIGILTNFPFSYSFREILL